MTAALFDTDDGEVLPVPGASLTLWRRLALPDEPSSLERELIDSTPWRSDEITVFGKTYRQPRLTAWYGDPGASYRYSGLSLEPLPWTPTLARLRAVVEAAAGASFNSVLLNYYRDGNDSMGLHSDDEPELGPRPVIASLSLGETRTLALKHRHDATIRPVRVDLTTGSLLVMAGDTQRNWKHGISKSRRVRAPRVNLTFRRILLQRRRGADG